MKTFIAILVLIMLTLAVCTNTLAATYTMREATVCFTIANIVIVETNDGNVWTFNGTGFMRDTNVQLVFDHDMIVNAWTIK